MNGAESLIRTALDAGIEVCFANPGTTEMPLVAALDAVAGMRAVLGLFEGVCTGAADGYARMADKPALTLTHLGPDAPLTSDIMSLAHNVSAWIREVNNATAAAPDMADAIAAARQYPGHIATLI